LIRHIVFFTVPADKVDEVRDGLSMLAGIPQALAFEVGINMKRDLFDNEVDLIVYAEFENAKTLDAFNAHPLYQASIDIVKPLRKMRIAADYETNGDGDVGRHKAGEPNLALADMNSGVIHQ